MDLEFFAWIAIAAMPATSAGMVVCVCLDDAGHAKAEGRLRNLVLSVFMLAMVYMVLYLLIVYPPLRLIATYLAGKVVTHILNRVETTLLSRRGG